jgi:hypothetical protein
MTSLKSLSELSYQTWDKTIILFITSHGLIIEEQPEKIKLFTIPDGIIIKRALISTPGECNIVGEQEVNGYVKLINSLKSELTSNRETTQNEAIQKVVDTMEKIDYKESKIIEDEIKELQSKSKKNKLSDVDLSRLQVRTGYIHNLNKGFNINFFGPGKQILNKTYIRSNLESTKNDWVIKVLNIPGQPDLLSFLKIQTRGGDTNITLEEIISFLKSKGVETVILFDLSCSNVADTDLTDVTERSTRRYRRDILNMGYGGKRLKVKKIKKSMKTKKNKKTRKTMKNKNTKNYKKQ